MTQRPTGLIRVSEAQEWLRFNSRDGLTRFVQRSCPAAYINPPGGQILIDADLLAEHLDLHRAAPLEPAREVQQ